MNNPLASDPIFGVFSNDQKYCLIATADDCMYINLIKKSEIDMDDQEGISCIKNCSVDKDYFYLFTNKKEKKLGYYFLRIPVKDPTVEKTEYFIKWTNKLDCGDCNIDMIYEGHSKCSTTHQYAILSFKSVGINTFNVLVFDVKHKLCRYWHESY
tara:strand:+ start:1601 stop:2065 length:465 start_codon:yes stop_codon:yes gene_type:complete